MALLSRRFVTSGLMLSLGMGLASLAPTPAAAQNVRISRIVVDTEPLRARGISGSYLAALDRSLRRNLGAEFADSRAAGGQGATLIVRIDGLSMNDPSGPSRRGWGGDSSSDYMDGTVTVAGPRNELITSFPLMNTLPTSSGGAWYDPNNEAKRLDALGASYAQWVRRKLG